MNRKAIIVPLENKKDQQVSNDIKRTPRALALYVGIDRTKHRIFSHQAIKIIPT